MSVRTRGQEALAAEPLRRQLQRTFRSLLTGVGALALLLGVLAVVQLGYVQPDLRYDTDTIRALRLHHEAMLARESSLRAWLLTGNPGYLDDADVEALAVARDGLVDAAGRDRAIDRVLFDVLVTSQAWNDGWAEPVLREQPTRLEGRDRQALVADGTTRFEPYLAAQQRAIALVADERDTALDRSRDVLIVGLLGVGAVALGVGFDLRRRRHELDRQLEAPLAQLLGAMDAMGRGDEVVLPDVGPEELRRLSGRLRQLDAELRDQRARLEQQHRESEAAAEMLRTVLAVAREISGSLNVRYVAESVAEAAAQLGGGQRAVVWLWSDDVLMALHDTAVGHGGLVDLPPVAPGEGLVGTVAHEATARDEGDRAVLPLVVGGRVVGVLEVEGLGGVDGARRTSVETLASHAGAALEASRLHRAAEDLAQIDPLTQLANRRRLDGDLTAELERTARYGRPLGLVMLDLDHFKALNDTFGHQVGDDVLRRTAARLAEHVRATDTVYRYGGEEFAVLARESGREEARLLAERLRAGLATCFGDGAPPVTASFGVAVAPENGQTVVELLQAADRALYDAKEGGRDRVVCAELSDIAARG